MSENTTRQPLKPKFAPASSRYGRMFPTILNGDGKTDRGKLEILAWRMIESDENPGSDNTTLPAAYTYFGQFVDHDLTLDLVSTFEAQIDPESTRNFRTAALELDSVYGLGPQGSPYLYQRNQPGLFKLGQVRLPFENCDDERDLAFDLPRVNDDVALISDPRNDENLFVNQLHVAFLRLHNHLFKAFIKTGSDVQQAFLAAQQSLRWHYQWLVLKDYLPKIAGKDCVASILSNGRRLYDSNNEALEAYLPIEFAVAAFRFGHSQIRSDYTINGFSAKATNDGKPVDAGQALPKIPILGTSSRWPPYSTSGTVTIQSFRDSLRGGPVRERDIVNWSFMVGDGTSQPSRSIGPRLSDPLRMLPPEVVRDQPLIAALARRNLLRAESFCLPDGRVAAAFAMSVLGSKEGMKVLPDAEIWPARLSGLDLSFVPLWYYLLREAEHFESGMRLGPLGARIVAEVLIGVLQKDPKSILTEGKAFTPDEAFKINGVFDLAALLKAAEKPFST